MKIAIPSYKRHDFIKVFNWIPLDYKENVFLFVRKEEHELYRLYEDRCNIVVLADYTSNIGNTRRQIIEYFDNERIWMIDDDIKLVECGLDDSVSYIKCLYNVSDNYRSFYECMDYINSLLDGEFSYGYIGPRVFPKDKSKFPYEKNVGVNGTMNLFLDLRKIDKDLLIYDKLEFFEDVIVMLNLFKNDYDFVNVNKYGIFGEKPNVNGGCASTRTTERVNKCIDYVHSLFPDYSKIVFRGKTLNIPGEEPLKSLRVQLPKKLQIY